jgi:hypothetical protein
MAEEDIDQAAESWATKAILVGAALGALVGAGAAYLLIQRARREDGEVHITAGDGVKLGLLVLGLLRQVGQLGEGEK